MPHPKNLAERRAVNAAHRPQQFGFDEASFRLWVKSNPIPNEVVDAWRNEDDYTLSELAVLSSYDLAVAAGDADEKKAVGF